MCTVKYTSRATTRSMHCRRHVTPALQLCWLQGSRGRQGGTRGSLTLDLECWFVFNKNVGHRPAVAPLSMADNGLAWHCWELRGVEGGKYVKCWVFCATGLLNSSHGMVKVMFHLRLYSRVFMLWLVKLLFIIII